MTASFLKRKYQEHNPEGHFFDRETMRYFGDTMKNFGVKAHAEYWELYRKQPSSCGCEKKSWMFDKKTFKLVR